ncbi:MAG: pyruvate kinase alpha/beta domain-containing protein [Pseudomonadota bacterium]
MYFDTSGKENTLATLQQGYARGQELGITEVVLATTSGETALAALKVFTGFQIIAVTYHCGFNAPFQSMMPPENRERLAAAGVRIVQATHALSGIERSVAKKHGGVYPALIIADALKLFGQGTKVAVEVAVMAADAGLLSGGDIVAIGGSSRGADAALIVAPAHQDNFFDLKVREVVCKPRQF